MKWLLVALIVSCTVLSDVLQSHEMRRTGHVDAFNSAGLKRIVRVFAQPMLLLSIFLLAISFFAFLRLLMIAPLSFSVPVTACTYVFDGILAKYLLKERVNKRRWAGILLIAAGVVLIAP